VLIAMLSAKGAPGVTTSALALALGWPRSVVLAEFDPTGGEVLAGYGRAEVTARDLAELELASRHGQLVPDLDAHLLRLDATGRVRLLPGLADPAGARHMDWGRLAAALTSGEDPVDVVVDCGRLRTQHFPIDVVSRAATVVLVTGSTLRAVRASVLAVAALRELDSGPGASGRLMALVVAPGQPYGEREIGEALGVPVLGVLPRDERAATVLSDGAAAGRSFPQSALMRAARSLAASLADTASAQRARLEHPAVPTPPIEDAVGARRGR
jgi:MinD-like ATPase involved in chromosome partitioning or flagellar assembly